MTTRALFRAERLPVLQNRTFATRRDAVESPTGDVVLVQDSVSGLVYNAAFDPTRIAYGEHYQNEQACSGAFRGHLADVARILEQHGACERQVLEIGCGKGFFLEYLLDRGVRIVGVDPAYEGTNPNVLKTHFAPGLGISGDLVVLRHVLEHIPNPASFLAMIADANRGRGAIYIEVPCFDWICERRAWFDIFYEHVNYFRLSDFGRMFGRVLDSGRVFGGQYIYVVADLSTVQVPRADNGAAVTAPDFHHVREACFARVRDNAPRGSAIWGGASKGVIFSIYMQRAGLPVNAVIDINPAKQGRYLPISGVEVLSPELGCAQLRDGDTVFVMNSNYMDEIVAASQHRYSYVAVDL